MIGGWRGILARLATRAAKFGEEIVPGHAIGRSIDMERLICPLRYDLCVRIEFIRLLRDEPALYERDLDGFLRRPAARAYYVWFKEIACARYRRDLYPSDALVTPAFIERVHETAGLWRSIQRNGDDTSTPIRLWSGRSIRSVNGKPIASEYFAGDGCHRLSCLYLMGQRRLEPAEYEVRVARRFQPLDNTSPLIRLLPLDRTAYLRFISRFYCGGLELESADEILRHVRAHDPNLLAELTAVFDFDLPRVSA